MRASLLLVSTLLASGCQLTQAEEPIPAVLLNPGAEVKAELQQVIQQAIGGNKVKLADDALTQSATLYIEQALGRDAQGNPIMGRHNNKPEVFHLQLQGNVCQLQHGTTDKVYLLKQASCKAL